MPGFANRSDIVDAVILSPVPMVLSNPGRPDNPLEIVNTAFCALTGYSEGEIVGRNCRFLAGPDTDREAQRRLRTAIEIEQPVLAEILNYRRDRSTFRNGVTVAPIYDGDGKLAFFFGSQLDLGAAPFALAERRINALGLVASLTPRQREVLQATARGLRMKEIAWELKISIKTVEIHRATILTRFGVKTSGEAIRIAVEAGL